MNVALCLLPARPSARLWGIQSQGGRGECWRQTEAHAQGLKQLKPGLSHSKREAGVQRGSVRARWAREAGPDRRAFPEGHTGF